MLKPIAKNHPIYRPGNTSLKDNGRTAQIPPYDVFDRGAVKMAFEQTSGTYLTAQFGDATMYVHRPTAKLAVDRPKRSMELSAFKAQYEHVAAWPNLVANLRTQGSLLVVATGRDQTVYRVMALGIDAPLA